MMRSINGLTAGYLGVMAAWIFSDFTKPTADEVYLGLITLAFIASPIIASYIMAIWKGTRDLKIVTLVFQIGFSLLTFVVFYWFFYTGSDPNAAFVFLPLTLIGWLMIPITAIIVLIVMHFDGG